MIRIRKMGADKQIHSSGSGKAADTRATVAQHGYLLKITSTLNFQAMTEDQAAEAVAEMLATIAGAATTARDLRYTNPPMIGVSELSL
jgi:hypothetical protein